MRRCGAYALSAIALLAILPTSASAQTGSAGRRNSSGRIAMREAGELYAAGDLSSSLAALDEVIRHNTGSIWEREGLYLRASIKASDNDDLEGALRDYRALTARHPGTVGAVYGQFQIARHYHRAGDIQEAYREYVLCSRLRGYTTGGPNRTDLTEFPAPRLSVDGARDLVELAALRAARLYATLPPRAAAAAPLPRHTFLLSDPPAPVTLPSDMSARSAPEDLASVWYVVSPSGTRVSSVSVDFSAYVDAMSGGAQFEKRFSMVLESCDSRDARERSPVLALSGIERTPRRYVRTITFDTPASAVRVTLYRRGARVKHCVLRATLVNGTADAAPTGPVEGLTTVVDPVPSGAGSPCLVAGGRTIFLAYHAPGPSAGATPERDTDLYMIISKDGTTWSEPARLPVSSAVDDRDPTLALLPDGRLLLAFTSDRLGGGSSDLYISETRDTQTWSPPRRLVFQPQDLESFRTKSFVMFHKPALHVNARGTVRLFFIARGNWKRTTEDPLLTDVDAAGLYGIVSEDTLRWSKPAAIISTPHTPLDRFGDPPRESIGKEFISWTARPSVATLNAGALAVAWVTTHGRVLISRRDRPGAWNTVDSRLAGERYANAATSVALLGTTAGGNMALLLTRRDLGARLVWGNARKLLSSPVVTPAPPFPIGCPFGIRSVTSDGWLSAWVALSADAPTGLYLREVRPPASND